MEDKTLTKVIAKLEEARSERSKWQQIIDTIEGLFPELKEARVMIERTMPLAEAREEYGTLGKTKKKKGCAGCGSKIKRHRYNCPTLGGDPGQKESIAPAEEAKGCKVCGSKGTRHKLVCPLRDLREPGACEACGAGAGQNHKDDCTKAYPPKPSAGKVYECLDCKNFFNSKAKSHKDAVCPKDANHLVASAKT